MSDLSRRTPKRPIAFWTLVAVVAGLGLGALASLAVSTRPPAPAALRG